MKIQGKEKKKKQKPFYFLLHLEGEEDHTSEKKGAGAL